MLDACMGTNSDSLRLNQIRGFLLSHYDHNKGALYSDFLKMLLIFISLYFFS